jgi:hypothetical protein
VKGNPQRGEQKPVGQHALPSVPPGSELVLAELHRLDDLAIHQLIDFLRMLEQWDREAHGNETL